LALGDLAGIIDQPLSVAASVFVFNMVFLAIAVWFPINTVITKKKNYFLIRKTPLQTLRTYKIPEKLPSHTHHKSQNPSHPHKLDTLITLDTSAGAINAISAGYLPSRSRQ
jgi:hypothetical protein